MPTWPTPGRQVGVHGIPRNDKGLGIASEGAVEQVKCRLPAEVRNTRVGMNPNIPSNQFLLGICPSLDRHAELFQVHQLIFDRFILPQLPASSFSRHQFRSNAWHSFTAKMTVPEFNILTPNAMLGYGYNVEHFWYGIQKFQPTAIIVDSGSTDGGPYKLGMNKMTCGRGSYIRDLEPILTACFHHKAKVLIGSVGGDGSNKHVEEMFDIVSSISQRLGFTFKVATINAGMERELIKTRIQNRKVGPCGPVEDLLPEVVDGAVDVVAQMGAEP
jgi:hypothetical protein